jgi:hypothetical protein
MPASRLLKDPRVDPSANKNKAIREACYQGYVDAINLLLTDPRVTKLLEERKSEYLIYRKKW